MTLLVNRSIFFKGLLPLIKQACETHSLGKENSTVYGGNLQTGYFIVKKFIY